MPGLFGYCDTTGQGRSVDHEAMARALAVRPGTTCATAGDAGALIGIVDRGTFPGNGDVCHNATGTRHVCFAGEIVGRSGGEDPIDSIAEARACLLESTSQDRLACAVGSFAAAVLDTASGTLELVSDAFGTCPLYCADVDGLFLFASAQKALLATGHVPSDIDRVAVSSMLHIGYVGGDATLLRCIRVLPPRTVLRVGQNGQVMERYWQPEFRADRDLGWREAVGDLARCVRSSVRRVMQSGIPTCVPVSGGLDSRVLLGCAPEPTRVPSYTFGIEGCRDLVYGARVACAVGSPHTSARTEPDYLQHHLHLGVWMTEGLLGANHFHILPHVTSFARLGDVVLDGIGGDVILGGKYVKEPWLRTQDLSLAGSAIWSWLAIPSEALTQLCPAQASVLTEEQAEAKRQFCARYAENPGQTAMDKAMVFLLEDRTRRFIGGGRDLIRYAVETHHPFLDQDLLRSVARVPHEWRKRQRLILAVVKEAAPTVSRVAWQRTGLPVSVPFAVSWSAMACHRIMSIAGQRLGVPLVPRGIETSDFGSWFRGSLADMLDRVLLSERSLDRGLVPPDLLRAVVRAHRDRQADWSNLLGVFLSMEQFCRCLLDDFDKPDPEVCVA